MFRKRNHYIAALSGVIVPFGAMLSTAPGQAPDQFNTSDAGTTSVDFGALDIPPIPADFFGPGSDPFEGQVVFQGSPDHDPDTLMQRSGPIDCPGAGFPRPCAAVDIEIISLNLVSTEPITVTYSGGQNPELWDVQLSLSAIPQVPGSLNATMEKPEGGLFTAIFPLIPSFQFQLLGGGPPFELDYGLEGIPPLDMLMSLAPWVISTSRVDILAPSNGNFVPLVNNGGLSIPSPLISQAGGGAIHWIEPVPNPDIPAVSQWGLVALTLLVLSAGTVIVARRRKVLAGA